MTSLVRNPIGSTLLHYTTLDSTNQCALDLLAKTRPTHGTVISADFQRNGRGQIGRSWVSEPGENVCLSVILFPSLPAVRQFQLNATVARAVRHCVAHYLNAQVSIKWPNDIYAGDKKIAGILIQNSLSGTSIRHCVAGIGLNVNQRTFPASLPNPTSLALETGGSFRLAEIMRRLCSSLEQFWQGMSAETMNETLEMYNACLYKCGETAEFTIEASGARISGMVVGVGPDGRLQLRRDGNVASYAFNEIRMRV